MVKFYGFDLELFASAEIDSTTGLRSATDRSGGHWLIAQVADDPECLVWICAPVSARALDAVVEGRAAVEDALRHSLTGTVEVVSVEHGRAVPDRCLLCSAIPESLLPRASHRIAVAA